MKIKLTLDDISEMSIEELREVVERLDAESEQRKKDNELKLERMREQIKKDSELRAGTTEREVGTKFLRS